MYMETFLPHCRYGKGFGLIPEDSVFYAPNSIYGLIFYSILAITSTCKKQFVQLGRALSKRCQFGVSKFKIVEIVDPFLISLFDGREAAEEYCSIH